MSQVLQAVLAATLSATHDDHMVLSSRHVQFDVFLIRWQLWPDNLKADELRPHRLLQAISRVVSGIDITVPAIE